MDSSAAAAAPSAAMSWPTRRAPWRAATALYALGGITAVGIAIRFADLGLQSYHHDEVITAARVLGGSFGHMLHEVRVSESNPPLYYVLAWGWSQLFGLGEVGLRSLSALFGAATIPLAYAAGRELSGRRAGLIAAALVAVNPMLIWYSQEARSYALLVFFCTASLLFFLRARRSHSGADLALWALASGLALASHYFAFFLVAIEAVWLLAGLRSWRVAGAVAAVGAAGAALLPLIVAQSNPHHIGWIDRSPLASRLLQTGAAFLAGETGHVIAEPPRLRYALIPAVLVGAAVAIGAVLGTARERRGAALCVLLGLGVAGLATGAALIGNDYVVERNLLPALVPLAIGVAICLSASRARLLGASIAVLLCAYWLGFGIYVTQTPNLQRPDLRALAQRLGPPGAPRAIVTWRLAAEPIRYYLHNEPSRVHRGPLRVREIDLIGKPEATRAQPALPGFRPVRRVRLDRLTLLRYMSSRPLPVRFNTLRDARTGFGKNAVLIDGPRPPGGSR